MVEAIITELRDPGVRQTASTFEQRTPSWPMVREVGAPLLSQTCLRSRHVSVEWLQRKGSGPVAWRFRQDRHALFLFERGIASCRGTVDGRRVAATMAGNARLAFVPAGAAVEATFDVPARCSYVAALFDHSPLLDEEESAAGLGAPVPQVGFADSRLSLAVAQLRQELVQQDRLSRLMIEGFTVQVWALLHRSQTAGGDGAAPLQPSTVRTVMDVVRARLDEDVSIADLAALTGLGPRQFCRRFRAATGVSPARARDDMRLDLATTLLATTRRSVTEIASECGFSQPQHLATAFKRRLRMTPTAYRAAVA